MQVRDTQHQIKKKKKLVTITTHLICTEILHLYSIDHKAFLPIWDLLFHASASELFHASARDNRFQKLFKSTQE